MKPQRKQHGIALPLTLILLFVLTLVGVASLRTTLFEEDMTTNSRLRQIAFNAAETTLREGENHMLQIHSTKSLGRIRGLFFDGFKDRESGAGGAETCNGGSTGGYCTPVKYDRSGDKTLERWEDPALDVWNTTGRHRVYSNFADSGIAEEGVFEAPKYIIEFLGNFEEYSQNKLQTNCPTDPATGKALAPNDVWPFCAADPAYYRITVRATAGPTSRQAVAILQSTIKIP